MQEYVIYHKFISTSSRDSHFEIMSTRYADETTSTSLVDADPSLSRLY